jgi:molybdopterin-guanine dinucleotide biosynthesis protein
MIGIGGGYSGSGKTTVACEILKKLKGWGAIKYTKTFLYSSIIDNKDVLSEEGKDTKKLLDAGAEEVLWARAPFSELSEILPLAVEMLSHLKGIVVEGNSAIEILNPDIVIFVSGKYKKFKPGAEKILRMADIVIFDTEPPPGIPQDAERFRRDKVEDIFECLSGFIKN